MLKGQVLGSRGNRVAMVLALFLGLLAAVLTAVYLGSAKEDSGGGGGTVTVPVVVAGQDIGAGTRIKAEMITVKNLPQEAVLAGAFGAAEDIVGKVTRVALVSGEQVISSKITGSDLALSQFGDNPPLSLLVPEGMRALSVQVSSLAGAGGLIRPGDFVDVILSVTVDVKDASGQKVGRNQVAATILQNVQVLAIDQELTQSVAGEQGAEGEAASPGGEAKPDATTATLAVSPVHGEVLALADVCRENFSGRLSLSLRGFGDREPVTQRTEWSKDGPPPDCAKLLGVAGLP